MAVLERIDLILQHAAQSVVDARQAALQESGGEQERVVLGVEAQWNPEEPAKRPDVRRRAVCEPDLGRPPVGTAQLMHDVVQGRERAIPDVIEGLHSRLVDLPGQHSAESPVHRQTSRMRPAREDAGSE